MEPERYRRMMDAFDAVCDAADPERALAERCGDDASLLLSVRALLEEDARSSVFLDGLAGDLLRVDDLDEGPPALPGYTTGELLGRGGMGSVWAARQAEPERNVAIKVLHPWLLDERMVERFRGEAQALASLGHVGIPVIYEIGVADGRIFLAMERVDGRSLDEAVGDAPLRQRVQTLVAICDAVHHAHLRGLVHRDLKPANVRVLPSGQPKVLDFGLAAAVDPLVRHSLDADVAGTLGYMSPEQLAGQPVDLRSDVFALGVCLHQLLGGQPLPPAGGEDALDRARQHVLPDLQQQRPDVPAELAAIVARATAPDPDARYAGAAALGADLRRWLAREPVEAYGGSAAYLLRCFVRRHPVPVALAVALLVSLVAGLGWSLSATAQARAAEAVAAREAHQGEVMTSFLTDLFLQANPRTSFGEDLTVREALMDATGQLDAGAMDDDPEAEYALREAISMSLWSLGERDLAEGHLLALRRLTTDVLDDPYRTTRTIQALSELAHARGRHDEALERSLQAQAGFEALHDGDHADLGDLWHTRGSILSALGRKDEARGAYEQAIAIRTRLGDPRRIGSSSLPGTHNALAYLLHEQGDGEAALEQHLHALSVDQERLPPGHHDLSVRLHHVAWQLRRNGQLEEALAYLDRAAAIRAEVLDPEHIRVADQENLRGLLLWELGREDEGCIVLHDALRRFRDHYPEDDPRVRQGTKDVERCEALSP